MKPVPPENKGLSKLPKGVRNKMGYMAVGGMTKKKDEVKRVGGVSPASMNPAPKPAAPMATPKDRMKSMLEGKKAAVEALKTRRKFPMMAGGGMMKGYAKGGMANCGASMKPNGAARGK